jgi:DinB family protein
MDVNAAIQFQLQRTHDRVRQCLADLSAEEARRLPLPRLSPVVWQVGHLTFYDALYAKGAGVGHGMPAFPLQYEHLFKVGTGGEAEYPPIEQVSKFFDGTNAALETIARSQNLAKPVEGELYQDVGGMLIFACIHRNYHIGKMATLRALLDKPILFGPPSPAPDATRR